MIVITSIFPPTPAIAEFARLAPDAVIVVGDRKSPPSWKAPGVEFLAVEDQEASRFKSAHALPWNHYSRKNVGYLRAIERGARVLRESDDDNTPMAGWGFPEFDGVFDTVAGADYVNMYSYFTEQHVWPRGLPLDVVLNETSPSLSAQTSRVGIWQGLADGDPDVDAIYRLTVNTPVTFSKEVRPVVLDEATICPFNSQNTAFRYEAFPLLYLPATVTFRFTDILRGIIAQPILWAAGMRLGFTTASVFQDRNAHDYMKDFVSEIPCYLQVREAANTVTACVTPDRSVKGNLIAAYEALEKVGIVEAAELSLVRAWADDLSALGV